MAVKESIDKLVVHALNLTQVTEDKHDCTVEKVGIKDTNDISLFVNETFQELAVREALTPVQILKLKML